MSASVDVPNLPTARLSRFIYLRRSLPLLIGWPLLCMLAIAGLWCSIAASVRAERDEVRNRAFSDAASLANAYNKQVFHAIQHLDERLRTIDFTWEKSEGTINLEQQANRQIYVNQNALVMGITDPDGKLVSSLPGIAAKSIDLGIRPYFQKMRNVDLSGLHIERREVGQYTDKPFVIFARPLTTTDRFKGAVFISVPPDYLASFYDQPLKSQDDVVAVLKSDGTLIASIMGENIRKHRTIVKQESPLPSPKGVAVIEGSHFVDGLSRIVAWESLTEYPLVSIAALSERAVYAEWQEDRARHIQFGTGMTLLLVLSACMGVFFVARLAWRRHQTDVIKQTYRLATDNAQEAFFMLRQVHNERGELVELITEDCNERGAEFLGRPRNDLLGCAVSSIYPSKQASVLDLYRKALAAKYYEDEFQIKAQGAFHGKWYRRRIAAAGREGVAVTLRDVTEAKEHEHALQRMANFDSLTGLPNRHWLTAYLPRRLQEAQQTNTIIALLFLDLDDFRNVNNTEGHAAGDALLQAAARRMKELLRPDDHVVRLGGDEFTIILERIADAEGAMQVADRLGLELARPFGLGKSGFQKVKASIGVSVFPEHGTDLVALLQHADVAMYAAKAAGKGKHMLYSPAFSADLLKRVSTLQALQQALLEDELVVHYQPRVDARTGELQSMEALVRWQHPERGLVPPGEFIALAEESGLIVQLGEQVLKKVCQQLVDWREKGLTIRPISVNVSPKQFQSQRIETLVKTCLEQHGLLAELLELEITESCMMPDQDRTTDELSALKDMGIRISVDDFGTGYSSLSQLHQLNLDVLKVDRAFVNMLTKGPQHRVFFETIVTMAHTLGMRVVAEGVETVEQLRVLQELACDELQGYLISRPVPATDVPALLQKKTLFPLEILNRRVAT